ncbi:MAG: TIGR02757 family protein [Candidatus Hydrogenedentota bacterium]
MISLSRLREALESLYRTYNQPAYITPDPLSAVLRFGSPEEREIVGIVAASLAYGRAAQIEQSIDAALAPMENAPRDFVMSASTRDLRRFYSGFRHRWSTGEELAALLAGIRRTIGRYGSLRNCFAENDPSGAENTIRGLSSLVSNLGGPSSLLSDPAKNSASKRLHLYLRWMVRNDAIDPGCWPGISASRLIIPLDTHMQRIARGLAFTSRKGTDAATALEVTEAFRRICPEDPLRYDFVLTRLGIRADLQLQAFLAYCALPAEGGSDVARLVRRVSEDRANCEDRLSKPASTGAKRSAR